MTKMAAEANCSSGRALSVRQVVELREIVSVGAAGAPTFAANDSDDPAVTIALGATGTYNITFPAGKRAWIDVTLYSPAKTVVAWCISALNAGAGTATIKTLAGTNAAADTNPASGDKLYISVEVEK
jgi:hypothetical protein